MEWSIFPYNNDSISCTKENIDGIPFLRFRPKDCKGVLPTVIYYHGWHSSKEFKVFEAQIISSYGYQVIVPDALYHGERDPIDHDDSENLDRFLWEIVFKTVTESRTFIDKIIDSYEADYNRICVMGTSMGAFSAGGIFILNPHIKCLIGINGTFSWKSVIEKKHRQYDEEFIKEYNPINNLNKLNKRAILMLHGTEDTSVPIDGQKNFFTTAKTYYTNCPWKIELVEFSGVNHRSTVGMLENAVMWIKKFL